MENNENKFFNKLIKVQSIDGRTVIGRLKCIDNLGSIYLAETVEVFDKNGDYYTNFGLYNNCPDHLFNFESDKFQYQIYSPVIVPKDQVKKLSILKEEVEINN